MQALQPASLEINESTLLNKNFKKTPANKTIKNKNINNFSSNNYNENIIEHQISNFNEKQKDNDEDNSSQNSNKLTNINQLMKKLYSQNNEAINNSEAIIDNTIYDVDKSSQQFDNNIVKDNIVKNNTLPNWSTIKKQNSDPIPDSKVNGSEYDSIKTDYNPYYRNNMNISTNNLGNDELLNKLNYIIHMMEEQQNQKTNYVTEELILYVFLGIFIIFVLDNFTKSSKYIR